MMEPLPVGPFAWGWALAGVGLTLVASCTLMPWVYLEMMFQELARQDREDIKAAADPKVVPFKAPRAPASWLGRRIL